MTGFTGNFLYFYTRFTQRIMRRFFEWLSRNSSVISRSFLFLISVAFIVFLFPREGKFKYEFQKGTPWLHEDLIAPFDFPIYKTTEELDVEESEAILDVKPVFYLESKLITDAFINFETGFPAVWNSHSDGNTTDTLLRDYWYSTYHNLLDSILSVGIIEMVPAIEGESFQGAILLRTGKDVEVKMLSDFFTIRTARDFIFSQTDDPDTSGVFHSFLVNMLSQNVLFDNAANELALATALKDISPTRGMVQYGERIISRGDLVTRENYQILNSLKIEFEQRFGSSNDSRWILAGQILLAIIAMSAFVLFLGFFRKDIFLDRKHFILVLGTILAMIAISSLVVRLQPQYIFLVPVCLVPVIIRVFYDHNLALFTLFIVLIITGFVVPNSFEFIFLQLITGTITIITIVSLQRRSQFFFTSLVVFLTYSIIYLALQLSQDVALRDIDPMIFAQFGINGALMLMAFPLIYIYEKLFRMVTDITLMELSDTNNRLLRTLATEAPGTFQHSIMVANLAEDAVRAIGGNPLLVRTGALYHDIGKIDNPQYFVENQIGSVSPHEELSYEESALIIKKHVLQGVDRARRYNLPDQIVDFIRTHHGTGKIGYFYAMAQREENGEPIDERIYTYPGPEPFSKETCVLMMADSVEAASRTLKDPSEANINELVEKIISKQIAYKQFENAEITFKDISTVKDLLKKRLKNMYHVRIEYPSEATQI